MADIQKSLQKMALILDRVVQKVEEMDERLKRLEQKVEAKENLDSVSKSNSFKGSFLGPLAGVVAGMGLYHLLFDDDITPQDMAQQMGVEQLEGFEDKFEEIDNELDEILAQMDEEFDFDHISLDDYLASEESFDEEDEV